MSRDSLEYPKAPDGITTAGCLIYIGGLLLMVSFFSPYWLSSYDDSFSDFKNMGVWEYCFNNYRYPRYQEDKVFDGCNGIFSFEYRAIREWLLPGWLLALEFLITIGLISTLISQLIVAGIVIRYPLKFVLKQEYLLITASFVTTFVTCLCIILMLIIFPWNSSRRDWLRLPRFNHISWAYYILYPSLLLHVLGAALFFNEAKFGWQKKKENRSLVMQQVYPSQNRYY